MKSNPEDIREFEIFDKDNSHEYRAFFDEKYKGSTFSLKYSNNGVWTEHTRDQEACTITDKGDGYKIEFFKSDNKKSIINLDYSEVNQLKILLKIIDQIEDREIENTYRILECIKNT